MKDGLGSRGFYGRQTKNRNKKHTMFQLVGLRAGNGGEVGAVKSWRMGRGLRSPLNSC